MKKQSNISDLFLLLPFFAPYKRKIIIAGFALLVTALTILFFGEVLKSLIDYGFVKKDQNFLNTVLAIFTIAVIMMALAGYFRSFMINSVAERVIADLRNKVYKHIINVSAQYFEIHKTGDVISRLTVDSIVLYSIISTTISFFLRNLILFFGGIIFIFLTSAKLSLVSLAIIPISIAPIIIIGRKIKTISTKSQESLASMGAHIEETINGIKTVQSYLCEDKEISNFSNHVQNTLELSLLKIRYKSLLIALVITLAFSGIGLVLWIGGLEVISGNITSGDLSSFIFYSVITATSLVSLSQISGQLQTASASAGRIFDILKVESPVKESDQNIKLEKSNKIDITFKDVNFAYPSRKDNLVIDNFSLEIKACDKISIVGASGCGKSTILQLLLRFYDTDKGSIKINDHDIKSLSLKDLRQNFSYIAQDPFIFSGTIFENIAYSNDSISKKMVQQLINSTKALHFINQFPQKLDSFVGEKGIKLSGGEKQRIAIARAIIKNSPILILDEATSALDNKNEKLINDILQDLAKDKTIIKISHKLSSSTKSDKIIYIKNGKIAEIGSHQNLIKNNGLYKKMYELETI